MVVPSSQKRFPCCPDSAQGVYGTDKLSCPCTPSAPRMRWADTPRLSRSCQACSACRFIYGGRFASKRHDSGAGGKPGPRFRAQRAKGSLCRTETALVAVIPSQQKLPRPSEAQPLSRPFPKCRRRPRSRQGPPPLGLPTIWAGPSTRMLAASESSVSLPGRSAGRRNQCLCQTACLGTG